MEDLSANKNPDAARAAIREFLRLDKKLKHRQEFYLLLNNIFKYSKDASLLVPAGRFTADPEIAQILQTYARTHNSAK